MLPKDAAWDRDYVGGVQDIRCQPSGVTAPLNPHESEVRPSCGTPGQLHLPARMDHRRSLVQPCSQRGLVGEGQRLDRERIHEVIESKEVEAEELRRLLPS